MEYILDYDELVRLIEKEIKENHPHITTDRDKYPIGYNNGLTMAKAIAMKLRKELVYCSDCVFYKNRVCVRKVKCGGFHAVDRVSPGFYCAAGKRREENGTKSNDNLPRLLQGRSGI